MLDSLRAESRAVSTPGGGWLHRDVIQKTATDILAAIQAFHAANPQRAGISREELLAGAQDRRRASGRWRWNRCSRSKQLERNGTLLARAGWSARIVGPRPALVRPDCREVAAGRLGAARLGGTGRGTRRTAAARRRDGAAAGANAAIVVRLDDRVWMHRDAVEAGKQTALKLFARAPVFSTMDFRDALGVSRKFAVPLVDYLDKIRFTVRSGNNRTPGAEAKKLLKFKILTTDEHG